MAQIFNLPNNKTVRRNLRKQEIGAESKLWYALRHDQLGFRFRRQYGIGKYVVDFYCPLSIPRNTEPLIGKLFGKIFNKI